MCIVTTGDVISPSLQSLWLNLFQYYKHLPCHHQEVQKIYLTFEKKIQLNGKNTHLFLNTNVLTL